MGHTIPEISNAEFLKRWDALEPVLTVEMGGIGDGYEMAIHRVGMEMLRYLEENPFDYERNTKNENQDWEKYRKKMAQSHAVHREIDDNGLSGAQFGAASNLATVINRHGYAKALKNAGNDRLITITKSDPHAL